MGPGVELVLDDPSEPACLVDFVDPCFRNHANGEQRPETEELAHGHFHLEFVMVHVPKGVLDLDPVGDAVSFEDKVQVVIGRGPLTTAVALGLPVSHHKLISRETFKDHDLAL